MQVAIVFGPVERYGCRDTEDVSLEGEAPVRQRGRMLAADEVGDRHVAQRKQSRPILKRLDRPALDPAGGPGGARRGA